MSSILAVQIIGLNRGTYALEFNHHPLMQQLSNATRSLNSLQLQPPLSLANVPKLLNPFAAFSKFPPDATLVSSNVQPMSKNLAQSQKTAPSSPQKAYLANVNTPAEAPPFIYQVKQGDTLTQIANEYQVPKDELVKLNQIENSNVIFVDQRLQIPLRENQNNALDVTNSVIANKATNASYILSQPIKKVNSSSSIAEDASNQSNSEQLALKLPPLSDSDEYLPDAFDGYAWPAEGVITSRYGMRWGRMHQGIDIAAPIGTPVVAAAAGEVVGAGWHSGYGNLVKLQHLDGSVTYYGHCNRILVTHGQQIEQGEQIAEMGNTGFSTGSHLHFEIHLADQGIVDPLTLLSSK